MSTVYVRGLVCGVNNCKSRLWRTIEGHKVCQYGHIREGWAEIGEDDDGANFVLTRRLNIPTLTQSQAQSVLELRQKKQDENERLYGIASKKLYLRCYQHVLRAQTRWLIEHKHVPDVLETLVRELWIVYLESVFYDDKKVKQRKHGFEESLDSDSTIDSNEDSSSDDGGKRKHVEKAHQEYTIPIVHSVVLCYIGCLILRVPLYSNDFVQLCAANKLPYLNCLRFIPKDMLRQLSYLYAAHLEPRNPPWNGEFYKAVYFVMRKLEATAKRLKFVNLLRNVGSFLGPVVLRKLGIQSELLLMRLVKELVLPKELFFVINLLIHQNKISFRFSDSIAGRDYAKVQGFPHSIVRFPEIRLLCLVVSSAKLYFVTQNIMLNHKIKTKMFLSKLGLFSWKKWLALFYQKKFPHQYKSDNANNVLEAQALENTINYLAVNRGSKEVVDLLTAAFGNDIINTSFEGYVSQELSEYLEWFEKSVVHKEIDYNSLPISHRRLLDIFKITPEEHTQPAGESASTPPLETYKNIRKVEKITFDNVLVIEQVLLNELSINFGCKADLLKYWVYNWSDKLLVKAR